MQSYGSSPRGRGTHPSAPPPCVITRFIPARAGNTFVTFDYSPVASVHPRAGGEHRVTVVFTVILFGSSPRGRGTPLHDGIRCGPQRFIPARAGNTRVAAPTPRWSPVHPRAGGEHWRSVRLLASYLGSSPRGRGTRASSPEISSVPRFIPARAGNTDVGGPPFEGSRVHPRAGGEHIGRRRNGLHRTGSSPRGRGTPVMCDRGRAVERFIPARAGNTRHRARAAMRSAVHPRAGGEHRLGRSTIVSGIGSSPRGRGNTKT